MGEIQPKGEPLPQETDRLTNALKKSGQRNGLKPGQKADILFQLLLLADRLRKGKVKPFPSRPSQSTPSSN